MNSSPARLQDHPSRGIRSGDGATAGAQAYSAHGAPDQPSTRLAPAPFNTRLRAAIARTSPDSWVCLLLAVFAAVWLSHLSYTSLSPPTDNIEQLSWMRALEWGYYKHPPLPTWLFWLSAQFLGAQVWTTYLLAALLNLGSLYLFWRIVARIRGHSYAALALFAVLCMSYYNMRLHAYNHNTVLTFFSTLSAVLCWKAVTSARQRWWVALGIALGLGMLTKYQIAVTVASVLVFWVTQRGWRDPRQRRGLLLCALVALLITVPHLQWLRTHDFGPIGYALETSLGAHLDPLERVLEVSNWLADQLLNRALAAWLVLAAALYLVRRRADAPAPPGSRSGSATGGPTSENAGRALLLAWGVVPLLFMAVVGLGTGALLQMRWGSPFLLFVVPAAMELTGQREQWRRVPLQVAATVFVIVQALLLLWSHFTSAHGPAALRDPYWRNFDSQALARQIEAPARVALHGGRICVVSGPVALAGALALQLADQPLVLIDGRYDRSPWVSVDLVKRCGMLQVVRDAPLPGGVPAGPAFPGVTWRAALPEHPPASTGAHALSPTSTTSMRPS